MTNYEFGWVHAMKIGQPWWAWTDGEYFIKTNLLKNKTYYIRNTISYHCQFFVDLFILQIKPKK